MKLESHIRNCLYLCWALPAESLPRLPKPLRYQTCEEAGTTFAFVSALLFRQESARFSRLPGLGLSFPQLNVRSYVLDDGDEPAVYFHHFFVPLWAVAPIRLLARHPVRSARFRYPESLHPVSWEWSVQRNTRLVCRVEPGSPEVGHGPRLGSWENTVAFYRLRNRGYVRSGDSVRRLDTEQPQVEVVPVRVQKIETALLDRCLPGVSWPAPHCTFLCPDLPLIVELGESRMTPLASQAAVPG